MVRITDILLYLGYQVNIWRHIIYYHLLNQWNNLNHTFCQNYWYIPNSTFCQNYSFEIEPQYSWLLSWASTTQYSWAKVSTSQNLTGRKRNNTVHFIDFVHRFQIQIVTNVNCVNSWHFHCIQCQHVINVKCINSCLLQSVNVLLYIFSLNVLLSIITLCKFSKIYVNSKE